MPIEMTLKAAPHGVPVRLWTDTAQSETLDQLKNVAGLPITYSHVAAMPDVHYGRGATVGSVIATRGAIIPAAVGVDIGCGMHAVRLDLEAGRLPDNLRPVREAIEARVPVGFARHAELKRSAKPRVRALEKRVDRVLGRTPEIAKRRKKLDEAWRLSLGTLGGGNHFIELCLDEVERVWLMLHSGRHTLGAAIGEHFVQSAREEAERLDRRLPDRDLGWLDEGTGTFDRYWEAVTVAQDYAHENRRAMTVACLEALADTLPPFDVTDEAIECHHNYASRERHTGADVFVTRKGAISARERCPGFAVRPQRVERYVDVHARMVAAVGAVLPVAAVHSIDELSAQLSPRDHPESVVGQVKRSVAGALTRFVPVSVGVTPSTWLAKCAAEAHKPSAAVVWRPCDLPAVYAGLELEDLPGAGPRICARLRSAGLATVASIYAASRSQIIPAWGSIEGERVRLALRGEDVPARVTRRRSVAHGRVLTGRDRCWREARQIVRWLAICALHRCTEGRQSPGRVRVEVVTAGGAVRGGVGRIDAFGHELDLLGAVTALWDGAEASSASDPPVRVGVVLERLCEPNPPSLFESDPRGRRLQWMIDRVRERFGARGLLWGFCGDPRGPYTGAKIAYQSFPDMARLRWLGIVANGALGADKPRARGLRAPSPGSIVRDPASA